MNIREQRTVTISLMTPIDKSDPGGVWCVGRGGVVDVALDTRDRCKEYTNKHTYQSVLYLHATTQSTQSKQMVYTRCRQLLQWGILSSKIVGG